MSRVVIKSAFCICENKDADQLCGKHEADQRLCFRDIDSTIPLLLKSEISIIIKSLDPLRAKKTFIRKKLGHTMVSAIKASSVTL